MLGEGVPRRRKQSEEEMLLGPQGAERGNLWGQESPAFERTVTLRLEVHPHTVSFQNKELSLHCEIVVLWLSRVRMKPLLFLSLFLLTAAVVIAQPFSPAEG